MKKIATIEEVFIDKNTYSIRNKGNSDSLYVLANFLYRDIPDSLLYKFIILWLNNKKEGKIFSSNTHTLKKDGNDIIILDQSVNYENEKYKKLYFKTSKKHLLKIIEDWLCAYVREPRPQKMLITQEDDGSITFKAFDSEGNEIEIEQDETMKEKIISFFGTLKKKFLSGKK